SASCIDFSSNSLGTDHVEDRTRALRRPHGAWIQERRPRELEFGGGPRARSRAEKAHLPDGVQGLHGSRFPGRAAVPDQEREDRPLGDAQGFGASQASRWAEGEDAETTELGQTGAVQAPMTGDRRQTSRGQRPSSSFLSCSRTTAAVSGRYLPSRCTSAWPSWLRTYRRNSFTFGSSAVPGFTLV